jgi:hypothetical protein
MREFRRFAKTEKQSSRSARTCVGIFAKRLPPTRHARSRRGQQLWDAPMAFEEKSRRINAFGRWDESRQYAGLNFAILFCRSA